MQHEMMERALAFVTNKPKFVARKSGEIAKKLALIALFPIPSRLYTQNGAYPAPSMFSIVWALFRNFLLQRSITFHHIATLFHDPRVSETPVGHSSHECNDGVARVTPSYRDAKLSPNMTALDPRWLLSRIFLAASPLLNAQRDNYSFESAKTFLKQYCQTCHQGKSPAGGFDLQRVDATSSLQTDAERWSKLNTRIRNGEMPPKGSPSPDIDQREQFTGWVDAALRSQACAAGITPGPSPIRRLNRDEYTATIRDLFDIHLDVGHALPADGAGGEGFDNAAETLFLSPLHSEKYMDVAKFATDFAAKEFKSRAKILIAKPGSGISEE